MLPAADVNTCNICNGRQFGAGPDGRLSIEGRLPRCLRCGSLERHRIARAAVDLIRVPELFARYRLIRFSPDPIVDTGWFASSELSIYEGENSCNLEEIDRPDESYDVIVCSHVLEHVRDDGKAMHELVRILSPEGFLLLIVPRSDHGGLTEDWGFADPAKNFHFRGYGRDFDSRLAAVAAGAIIVAVERPDPITGDRKRLHMLTKSMFWRERWLARVPDATPIV